MQTNVNPYEAPLAAGAERPAGTDRPAEELRRPLTGTVLLVLWTIEGGLKAFWLGAALSQGFDPLPSLVEVYPSWNPLLLFLLVAFMTVETIGPWIGVYYLTGRRARTIPFDAAMVRTLAIASAVALALALVLLLYCELAGSR